MTEADDWAAEVVEGCAQHAPEILDLAVAVSLASRVEPALLRRARLELCSGIHAGAESELWHSSLAQHRSPKAMVFAPAVAWLLQQRLKEGERPGLEASWKLLQATHAGLPDAIRLEEEITWRAVRNAADPEIPALLRRAVRTLMDGEMPDLAQWAARALPRLPPPVRRSPDAWLLALAASSRLGGLAVLGEPMPEGLPADDLLWIAAQSAEKVPVYLRRKEGALLLSLRAGDGGAQAPSLSAPSTYPVLLEATVGDGAPRLVALRPEGPDPEPLPLGAGGLRLRTAAGEVLRVEVPLEDGKGQGKPDPVLDLGRLPIPGPHFIGRDAELARLDAAWEDSTIHVLTLIAFGGVGKSALVAHWLDRMAADNWRGAARVLDWSFYSQGTKDHLSSAEPFIDYALRFFGDPDPQAGSPHDRGTRLANLVRQERTLLILDGVEPLQYPPGRPEIAGRLKDLGLAALLKGLAWGNPGLCIVTTRERIADLDGKDKTAPQISVEELDSDSAVQLLRALKVEGEEIELRAAVEAFGRHALTLMLLGNYLHNAHQGDIRRWREVGLREADEKQGGSAFRVIEAYARWLGEGPELAILRLLGLFDQSADAASLKALRAEPPILALTEFLVSLSDEDWQTAVATLREHELLAIADPREPEALQAAPLVRAYFADELKGSRPDAWQEGNLRLYEHLRSSAPEYPETLEAMQPLYSAIGYGCRAGRQEEVLQKIYLRRILRGDESFSWRKLGAFGSELTALSSFFDRPWSQPFVRLTATSQKFVLSQAGFYLRSLGRLAEAVEPMQASMAMEIEVQDWKGASASASNLSELTLTLGDVPRAVALGERSVKLADRNGDSAQRMSKLAKWANALHQAGRWEESAATFQEAEMMQRVVEPEYPRQHGVAGYLYCVFLLGKAEPMDGSGLDGIVASTDISERFLQVIDRSKDMVKVAEENRWLLEIALAYLSLGLSHHGLALSAPSADPAGEFSQAASNLDRAVDGLRRADPEGYLPCGLLARSALRRFRSDFTGAAADLSEVLEIAERGPMRLYECDAHLEWARLCRDQEDFTEMRRHVARARELVDATGYMRRQREVGWLENEIAREDARKDFFVSFHSTDKAWADWIAWTLEEAGYQVVYQSWDFRPGGSFSWEMQKAVEETRKTVIVLSDNYFPAGYIEPEWSRAFVGYPHNKRKLIPLRVAPCSPTGLLKTLIFADLVGLSQEAAKDTVLTAVMDGRTKSATAPAFPRGSHSNRPAPPFPGGTAPASAASV